MFQPRLIYAALSAVAISATAQNLKTEVTVDRTIVPVEREAQRLASATPQLLPTTAVQRRLTPADYTRPAAVTRSLAVLAPVAYADTFALSPYRGYASLGYFPVFNLGASAGYRFVDNAHTRLGAWLQYDGCSYKPYGEEQPTGHYSDNTVAIGATLSQRTGCNSSLGAKVSYAHAATGLPDGYANRSQAANMADAAVTWWLKSRLLAWHFMGAVSHFSYAKDVLVADCNVNTIDPIIPLQAAGETRFTVSGAVAFLGSSPVPRGGIDVAVDMLSRSDGAEMTAVEYAMGEFEQRFAALSSTTLGIISATPYYAFDAGRVHTRIGAKIEVSTGGEGKKFHIAPDVMLDWNMSSQFAVYARFGGGERLNTLRSLYDVCPYVGGLWQYGRSHVPLTADLGLNAGPFKGFSVRLFGGYAVANDWLMPAFGAVVSKGLDYMATESPLYSATDVKGWHCGIGMAYQWRSAVKAEVSAETASDGPTHAWWMWRDRAKYAVKASLEVKPMDALAVSLGYEFRSGRHYYGGQDADSRVSLRPVGDLSLGASYALTPALSVFVRGENLMNRRYDLLPAIQGQGLRGLVGATWQF